MIKRKTQLNNNAGITHSLVQISEGFLDDDPQKKEILNIWEKDEEGENEEIEREIWANKAQRHAKVFTAGSFYLCIMIVIGIFLYLANLYNLKQLERIKEEYGMDSKPMVPELWWQKALVYNLIVRSYKDSNHDGIGDLRGVGSRIDHLLYMGVDAVILSRILESPFEDFGNDVTNFTRIDPVYGTIQDLKSLIDDLHETGIKVFLELNPNHSHRKHQFFERSRHGDKMYDDYYIWHPGKTLDDGTLIPPSNWVSRYGGSAWSYDDVKGQYYYHYYGNNTADFNYRNPKVFQELQEMITYWLKQGFDGIYMEGAHLLYEVDEVELDEPESDDKMAKPGDYESLRHVYTEDHSDIHDLMTSVMEWMDRSGAQHNRKLALLLNIKTSQLGDHMKYYRYGGHAPVSRHLMRINHNTKGRDLWDIVDAYKTHLPEGQDPIWMLSDFDNGLLTNQNGVLYQNVLNMLMLLLPGAALSFMGEELGLGTLDTSQVQHLYKDDRSQRLASMMSPLSWNDEKYAGFSVVEPWLPLRDDYSTRNVEIEKHRGEGSGPLHMYGKLARLRKETSFMLGEIQFALVNDDIFSFMRFAKNSAPYLVTINIGSIPSTEDYTLTAGVQYGKVVAYAKPVGAKRGSYIEGRTLDIQKLTLKPGEGLVLLLLMDIVMDAKDF